MRRFGALAPRSCWLPLIALLGMPRFAPAQHAVVGTVETRDGQRLAGVNVRIVGVGETVTSPIGEFEFPSVTLTAGHPVCVDVWEAGKSWVVVSPFMGWTYLPQPGSSLGVRVLLRGDRRLISEASIPRIVEAAVSRLDPELGMIAQPDAYLAELAVHLGLEWRELESAIARWSERAETPYARGLAALYDGRYTEASALLRESLAASETDRAGNLVALASADFARGHYNAAQLSLIMARSLRPEDPVVLLGLGSVLSARGKYSDAEQVTRRALEIWSSTLGPEHPQVATARNALAQLLRVRMSLAEAESLLKGAATIRAATLGSEHPQLAITLHNLAEVVHLQGKYAEARPLSRRALAISETVLGPEHPQVANMLSGQADLLMQGGSYPEAERLYKLALAISETAPRSEHLVRALNNLATVLQIQGRYAEAEPLYRRALETVRDLLGSEHPQVALTLANQAELLERQGRHAEAEPLHRRALAISEAALGSEHPQVALGLNNLATVLLMQGSSEEALPLYRRALAICESLLGTGHPDVAVVAENLARTLRYVGRVDEARALEHRAASARAGAEKRN
jgi:tetratricopeptide (TPR) repeat protein